MVNKKVWSPFGNHSCFPCGAQKRGDLLGTVIVHIILIATILALLVTAIAGTADARGVRQQIVEKQTAMLIGSALPGMVFVIKKKNLGGDIHSVDLRDGSIFIGVDGFKSLRGYPYFSTHSVDVQKEEDKFLVSVS